MASMDNYNIGEQLVIALLRKNGYTFFEKSGNDILTSSAMRKMLVSVKMAQYPAVHPKITEEEALIIKQRAQLKGLEAWVAKLVLNGNQLVGDILWNDLSRL